MTISTKEKPKSKTKLYYTWCNMKSRCQNKNHKKFKNYGARGIKVCKKWQSFEGFFEDMGDGWKEGLSLERKNPHQGYNKNNCCWIPLLDQAKNKTNTITVTWQGKEVRLIELTEELNIEYKLVWQRINRDNKTPEEAIKRTLELKYPVNFLELFEPTEEKYQLSIF